MKLSERHGFVPIRSAIQMESMDNALKNKLWNHIQSTVWDKYTFYGSGWHSTSNSNMESLMNELWNSYFKEPVDTIPYRWDDTLQYIRDYYFACNWFSVYDFIDFMGERATGHRLCSSREFFDSCNLILNEEKSGYRFIGGQISPITSEVEIVSIEDAIEAGDRYGGARKHLETALKLLSDRQNPDYRNSIKESISAVESICAILSGDGQATLGKALAVLEKKHPFHGGFKSGLSSLYGYTSDADGIRHALLEEDALTFVDAKFMLVSCSAFINYLIGKLSDGEE